jgi:glycosyltransferase involved in cell wall biosynthesis/GT2 family glycosyltransferase
MGKAFSVVINTFNRASSLRQALSGVSNLRHPNFEVIVVNGPSVDETEEIVTANGSIKYAECAEPNLAKSRNIGIAMAKGDIVAFLDDDAIPEPDWLDQIEIGYKDPAVGAVGGFIRDHTGVSFQSKVVVCDRFGDACFYQSVDEAKRDRALSPSRYLSLTGANSTFRRDVLLKIGGFDEEYAYFLDETDVILRLVDAGYKVSCKANAEVHHKYAESHLRHTNKIPKSIYLPVRSKAYFCLRNASRDSSMNEILSFLQGFAKNLRRDKRWYLSNGDITEEHCQRLLSDIDLGLRDGIKDALSHPRRKLITSELIRAHENEYRQYPSQLACAQRLRVCFLSVDYPPNPCGGIGIWTFNLATALAKAGHEVSVVTRSDDRASVDLEHGVWVHRIVPTGHEGRRFPVLPDIPASTANYAYSVYDEVVRIHQRRGLDLVSGPIWDLEGIACMASNLFQSVLSLHSTYKLVLPSKPDWQANHTFRLGHVNKVIAGERWALENARHIMANSVAMVEDLQREYGITLDQNRCSVVPHGLIDKNTSGFDDRTAPRRLRLLFVGRLEERKGIDTLLDSLPHLLMRYENLDVVLVGDDSIEGRTGKTYRRDFLDQHHRCEFINRVRFAGFIDDNALREEYRNCDIFVAPSRYESFGLIFLEAMMFGKPVIGCRAGGMPEVISDGIDGFLIPPGDGEALQGAISKLLDSAGARAEMGRAARVKYETMFSQDAMLKQALRFYRDCLTKPAVSTKATAAVFI